MKRKLYIVTMSLLLIMSLSLSGVFADVHLSKINSVEKLKSMLADNMTEAEVSEIASQTDEGILNEFLMEKLDEAADTLLGQEQQPEMNLLPDGTSYGVQEYDLGDGCVLTVELTDTAEETAAISSMMSMAPTVQPDQWKAYGKRSFTAKASASIAGVTASMSLTHHYVLSADGIESEKGEGKAAWGKANSTTKPSAAVVSDRYAKTPGASDVNMSCNYTFTTSKNSYKYRLNTTVGYVAIDKSAKKIKVRHSWDLSKI